VSFRYFNPILVADRQAAAPTVKTSPVSSVALPGEIQVKISAHPKYATLILDGEILSANPYVRTMRRDNAEHTVRAEAPGYEPLLRRIVLDRDSYIALTLDPASDEANVPSRLQSGATGGRKTPNASDTTLKRESNR
jgi:hypothetical protein